MKHNALHVWTLCGATWNAAQVANNAVIIVRVVTACFAFGPTKLSEQKLHLELLLQANTFKRALRLAALRAASLASSICLSNGPNQSDRVLLLTSLVFAQYCQIHCAGAIC
jgi:hypothetical protein